MNTAASAVAVNESGVGGRAAPVDRTLAKKNFDTALDAVLKRIERAGRDQKRQTGSQPMWTAEVEFLVAKLKEADTVLADAFDWLVEENRRLTWERQVQD